MAEIRRIEDGRAAAALAGLLNGSTRTRPVVVVTIPSGRTVPWIDADLIAHEAGDLAEVYLMPTSDISWEFSHRMSDGTQVYGGAGRVYPVGHEWATDLSKSPLRFAFNDRDGERATQQLVSDAFRMASSAGLLRTVPTRMLREASGVVKQLIAGRALVDIGNPMPAMIAEELTIDDTAIDRLVSIGQTVDGWYDRETNRLDVSKHLLGSDAALAAYRPGHVVLTRVEQVGADRAELILYPKTSTPRVSVEVRLADVTGNPFDDLRTLMTIGEVIPARVTSTGPEWALVLNDVDDDEPILMAPSLLPGGPAWLVEEFDEPTAADSPVPALAVPSGPAAQVAPVAPEPSITDAPASEPVDAPPAPARPSPAMFNRTPSRPAPAPSSASPTAPRPTAPVPLLAPPAESTKALLLKIDELRVEVKRLRHEAVDAASQLTAAAHERDQLRYLLDQAERRANRAEHEVKAARSRLRRAGSTKPVAEAPRGPQFADAEQGFRYLVLTQWATRTPPAEQHDLPLPDYDIGPEFLATLDRLEGIKAEKIADVVFEIVTGRARDLPGREVHRLRTGSGGDDPIRVRDDGAICWRASLQVNTPSARRIHYWEQRNGRIELASVGVHDHDI